MKLICGRFCMFPYNYDNVALTRISRMIYVTCPKMGDGILTSLWLGLIHVSLCMQCYVLIFDGLHLVVTALKIITHK